MKSKFLAGLTLAAAFLAGGPAFAFGNHGGGGGGGGGGYHGGGGGGGAAFHGGGGGGVAAFHGGGGGGGGRAAAFSGGGYRGGASFAGRGASGYSAPAVRSYYERSSATPSIAYGGNSYNARSGGSNGGRHGNSTYAFRSHSGWDTGRQYSWHGHHYRWENNGWFIIDPYPYYGAGYGYAPGYGYGYGYDAAPDDYGAANDSGPAAASDTSDAPVDVQVQQVLARAGYYRGPIDGIIGPGSRSAIATYQRDNGLPVTGTINGRLLDALNLE